MSSFSYHHPFICFFYYFSYSRSDAPILFLFQYFKKHLGFGYLVTFIIFYHCPSVVWLSNKFNSFFQGNPRKQECRYLFTSVFKFMTVFVFVLPVFILAMWSARNYLLVIQNVDSSQVSCNLFCRPWVTWTIFISSTPHLASVWIIGSFAHL